MLALCFRMLSTRNASAVVNTASATVRQVVALVFNHATQELEAVLRGGTALGPPESWALPEGADPQIFVTADSRASVEHSGPIPPYDAAGESAWPGTPPQLVRSLLTGCKGCSRQRILQQWPPIVHCTPRQYSFHSMCSDGLGARCQQPPSIRACISKLSPANCRPVTPLSAHTARAGSRALRMCPLCSVVHVPTVLTRAADASSAELSKQLPSSAMPPAIASALLLLKQLCLMCRGHPSHWLETRSLSASFVLDLLSQISRSSTLLFRNVPHFLDSMMEDVCSAVLHVVRQQLEADTEQVMVRCSALCSAPSACSCLACIQGGLAEHRSQTLCVRRH